MTSKQENKHSMYRTVREFLLKYALITSTLPGFAPLFALLVGYIGQISALSDTQSDKRTGLAATKNNLRELLMDLLLDVSGKCYAYASNKGDEVFKQLVKFTDSDLRRTSDTEIANLAAKIIRNAREVLANLVEYDVNEQLLMETEQALANYDGFVEKPRLGIVDRRSATAQINVIFKSTDEVLIKLDALMPVVRKKQPVFFDDYFKARKIISNERRSLSFAAKITDSATGIPIGSATLVFTLANDEKKAASTGADLAKNVKRTGPQGHANLKSLPQGTYTVTISKPGYVTQTVTIYVVDGELCNLEVAMERV